MEAIFKMASKIFCHIEKPMATLKTEKNPRASDSKPQDHVRPPKTKFGVFGEEMIEKEVKLSGNTGRVYLPLDWVGKNVKIIRID